MPRPNDLQAAAAAVLREAFQPLDPLASSEVPVFPTSSLPEPVATFVEAVATATETPPDGPAVLALAALSAAAVGRYAVSPWAGWVEPLAIYSVFVAGPGERKSAVFDEAFGPIYERQRELVSAWRDAVERVREVNAGKTRGEPKEPEPRCPRLLCDDTTPERFATLLAQHGERLSIASAEGVLLDHLLGLYSESPNLSVFLKAHAGDRMAVDRQGNDGSSIYLDQPLAAIGVCAQPGLIARLRSKPELMSRGMLGRLFFAFPQSRVGYRTFDAEPVHDSVRAAWANTLHTLLDESMPPPRKARLIKLDDRARAALREFALRCERLYRHGGPAVESGFVGKLAGLAVRLAGLCHVVEHGPAADELPMSTATIGRGIALAGYALASFRRVVEGEVQATPDERAAAELWAWLCQRGEVEVTTRDLAQRAPRSLRCDKARLERAVACLVERGYLARVAVGRAARLACRTDAPGWLRGGEGGGLATDEGEYPENIEETEVLGGYKVATEGGLLATSDPSLATNRGSVATDMGGVATDSPLPSHYAPSGRTNPYMPNRAPTTVADPPSSSSVRRAAGGEGGGRWF